MLSGALLPLDQTFLLHSRAGSKRTIFLNFKGAVLNGTAWNSNGTPITAAPYDIDGSLAPSRTPSCSASSTSGSAWPRTTRRSMST